MFVVLSMWCNHLDGNANVFFVAVARSSDGAQTSVFNHLSPRPRGMPYRPPHADDLYSPCPQTPLQGSYAVRDSSSVNASRLPRSINRFARHRAAPGTNTQQSNTWVSPAYLQSREQRARNSARHHNGFQRSFAWTLDLDFAQHNNDMWDEQAIREATRAATIRVEKEEREFYNDIGYDMPPPRALPMAFHGHEYSTHGYALKDTFKQDLFLYGSPVLNQRSIWCVGFADPNGLGSMWPELEELKYEGPDRISTDRIHRRLLPHPRMPGNATVDWSQRAFRKSFVFDEFGYPFRLFIDAYDSFCWPSIRRTKEEALHVTTWIPEIQFTQALDDDTPIADGMLALGRVLVEALDE